MYIPKISVIVPIYNAGSYLRKTLDSIINQSLKDIEIILVLDCPTDGSDIVAQEYAKSDKRIILVNNSKNLNIGMSRNEGLKKAKGEYICFSDHDDFSEPDMFELMYDSGKKKNADVVICDFYRVIKGKQIFYGLPDFKLDKSLKLEALSYLIGGERFIMGRSITNIGLIWNQMYKREFLERNKIYFCDNNELTFEDRMFLINVYSNHPEIAQVNKTLYYHVCHPTSAGNKYAYRSMELSCNYLTKLYSFLNERNIYETERICFYDGVLFVLYGACYNEFKYKTAIKVLQVMVKIGQTPIYREAIRELLSIKRFSVFREYGWKKTSFMLFIRLSHR